MDATKEATQEMTVEAQAKAVVDQLLGAEGKGDGRLVAAVREQIEPGIKAKLEDMQADITTVKDAMPSMTELPAKTAYSPPPWAAQSTQIAQAIGLPDPNWANPEAIGAKLDGKFDSFSDFLRAMVRRDMKGVSDERLVDVSSAGDVRADLTGEEVELGGALVPEEFRPQLLNMMLQPTSIRSRATVLPMGSSSMSIPAIRDETHADGTVFGGVRFNWTEVNDTIVESEPDFKLVRLIARTLAGRTTIPNTLLEDSFITVPQLIMSLWTQAVPWIEESAFIRGDGTGKPLGILNSPALAKVSRKTANEFAVADMFAMMSRVPPGSMGRCVWMLNPQVLPQLGSLNSGDVQVWMPALSASMPSTLAGYPVIFNEHCSGLGTEGDVLFVDWMYYLIGDRQALSMMASPHEQFSRNRTVIRGVERIDAQPWIDTAIIPAQRTGSSFTLSPFVALSDA